MAKKSIAILIIFICLVTFIIYSPVQSCFTKKCESQTTQLGDFGDFLGGTIGPVLSFLSLIFALYVIYKNNEDNQFNHLTKLIEDYRSKKMCKDINILYKFYNKIEDEVKYTNEDSNEVLKKRYFFHHEYKTEVYYARRNVSYFYYHLSIYLKNHKINEKIIFEYWSPGDDDSDNDDDYGDLNIIKKILQPCEESTAEIISKRKGKLGKPNKIILFKDLLAKAKRYKDKKRKQRIAIQIIINLKIKIVRLIIVLIRIIVIIYLFSLFQDT